MSPSDSLSIKPRGPLDVNARVPGSKSISNRVLVISGLAEGDSTLRGILDCDDTRVMARALTALGARVRDGESEWTVTGVAGRPRPPGGIIDVRDSGTAARFLTAVSVLSPGTVAIDGSARMRERPIGGLVDALAALGARIHVEGENGCPPVRSEGSDSLGGEAEIDASLSSQYVSALLLIGPAVGKGLVLRIREGALVSRPYVELTLAIMKDFGAEAGWRDDRTLVVRPGSGYRAREYDVEPDASTAAYFFAAAAIAGGRVRVEGLPGDSAQADMGLLEVLETMGCRVERAPGHVEVRGTRTPLRAADVDMNSMPDAVLAMAVTALFAEGTTTIRNVANLRIKETDRLSALETEIRKLGARVRAGSDSIEITPGRLHGAAIDTYGDHRMAMSFALAGLRIPGVVIRDPACVSKSCPGYFEALSRL
jgi:3-phosphoshikimate 1-carboxyvinyltransferase